jgi:hypothetical protein
MKQSLAAHPHPLDLAAVHGEFLFMPRLAFGITRDNVSASHNISSLPAGISDLQLVFVPPEPNAFDVGCNNHATQLTSSPSRLPSRTMTGPNILAGWFQSIAQ